MGGKKEVKPVLEYTNNADIQSYKEGDIVICFTENRRCTGTIIAFGNYKESEDAEPQCSVYLDTSKNKQSRSCEIIKIADITYMCNVTTGSMAGYPKTNEIWDKDKFIEMVVALGYDKEKAENMYDNLKEIISLYNIPLSQILPWAIREADLSADGKYENELIKIADKVMVRMIEVFESVTNSIKEGRRNKIAPQDEK